MSSNLWSSLLQESSKRTKHPDSIAIFLGDSECGKTKLVERLCISDNKELLSNSEYVSKEIMSYNFLDIDDAFTSGEMPSKVGIWSISDKCFDNAIETVTKLSKSEKVSIICSVLYVADR
jgi:hypothetical protein